MLQFPKKEYRYQIRWPTIEYLKQSAAILENKKQFGFLLQGLEL